MERRDLLRTGLGISAALIPLRSMGQVSLAMDQSHGQNEELNVYLGLLLTLDLIVRVLVCQNESLPASIVRVHDTRFHV